MEDAQSEITKEPDESSGTSDAQKEIKKTNSFVRADKINLAELDAALERHIARAWSSLGRDRSKKEDWEIDPSKLFLKSIISRGTYGTVYKGIFDGQDVAGFEWQTIQPEM